MCRGRIDVTLVMLQCVWWTSLHEIFLKKVVLLLPSRGSIGKSEQSIMQIEASSRKCRRKKARENPDHSTEIAKQSRRCQEFDFEVSHGQHHSILTAKIQNTHGKVARLGKVGNRIVSTYGSCDVTFEPWKTIERNETLI